MMNGGSLRSNGALQVIQIAGPGKELRTVHDIDRNNWPLGATSGAVVKNGVRLGEHLK
jgi:hypothetical protein